ncbi:ATP-dependent metallopeptidase FtsH/Yme1/Tma family protein [Desnuesiella massiliensis]|uniref:ATP-dependent metallopeptidase FtsH/Yme1/Tma family protein n=1 Tax=Desnuesiella massiliensis TaxID=1650662 RepID=UPI0006E26F20|nr:FtsH/Yme1/Tma family ATP-dependent metallopeptidase [Desnuesiella massiliensis]
MNKLKNKYIIFPIIISILCAAFLIFNNINSKALPSKAYSTFQEDISKGNIDEVYISNADKIYITLKSGEKYNTDNPRSLDLKEKLLMNNVKVKEKPDSSPKEIIPSLLLGLSLLSILFIALKGNKIGAKGMLSVDILDANAIKDYKYNFNSMAGNEEAKESVKDIVDFLKNPEKYAAYGARMPKGIILYGEPGTGKTLLAKAVAGEAGVPFYAMSGSDFVQVYVGVGASRVRNLFKKAKTHGKAVIFIDEIDAIGKKRDGGKNGGSDERDQTLNALLTEMSGFNEQEGIVVMAATNRLDMLDAALLRPGRFDRHIEVTLPDINAREEILNLHLKNKPYQSLDIREWAHKTSYFSGAKLENLVNEAAILACKENSDYIENVHFDKAFSIVLAGYEKINRDSMKDEDKKITAYHEAGHAVISRSLLPNEKLSKVTIIPSSKGAGGYTLSIPEDRAYQNLQYLRNRIMVLLGGRAAEEIIFGEDKITTGAYSDIQHVTSLIGNMITEYGMGKTLGLLNLSQLSNIANINSEEILKECKNTVEELYIETKSLLKSNIKLLRDISVALLEKETLYYEDIENIATQ